MLNPQKRAYVKALETYRERTRILSQLLRAEGITDYDPFGPGWPASVEIDWLGFLAAKTALDAARDTLVGLARRFNGRGA